MPISSGLSIQDISKSFPGVQALQNITFDVPAGTVHALCGENGAGKSTLLKILAGVHNATSGVVTIDGKPHAPQTPADALKSGIGVIYQELHLVDELSIAENLFLGALPSKSGIVDKARLAADTKAALARIKLDVRPETRLGDLSLAQRQMVEIAKSLVRDARVVAFDEPTSSLSAREADTLFDRIAELRAAGKVVLYVSHRMDEIKRICDGATVFRDGQHVVTYSSLENVSIDQLVKDMVGRDITDIYGYTPRTAGDVLLEREGVTVRSGEIVGLFGLVGAGRSELLHRIYAEPRKCIQNGIFLCPEDRKHEGIIPMGSVAENINLSIRRVYAGLGGIWINDAKEKANAEKQVAAMRVKTPSLTQEIRNLSGGNQQKAILGRWLSEDIKVMLLDEPTRGIDVGAKREIYDILYRLAADGIGILMVSSELPEVLGTCDRVYVMRNNRISAEFSRSEATPERCLAAALPSAEDSL